MNMRQVLGTSAPRMVGPFVLFVIAGLGSSDPAGSSRPRVRRRGWTSLVVISVLLLAGAGCAGTGEDRVDSDVETTSASSDVDPSGADPPCTGVDLNVPSPTLRTGSREVALDYLWSSHPCGYNGDGAANLGAELTVIVVEEPMQLAVDPRFEIAFSLHPDGRQASDLGVATRADDGLITVGPLPSPCSELTVGLADGELSARFAARLATHQGACA